MSEFCLHSALKLIELYFTISNYFFSICTKGKKAYTRCRTKLSISSFSVSRNFPLIKFIFELCSYTIVIKSEIFHVSMDQKLYYISQTSLTVKELYIFFHYFLKWQVIKIFEIRIFEERKGYSYGNKIEIKITVSILSKARKLEIPNQHRSIYQKQIS